MHDDDEPRPPTPRSEARSPSTEHELELEIADPDALLRRAELAELEQLAHAAMTHLGASGSVRVLLVDDETMTEAHIRTMGLDSTTDVLTFDLSDAPQTDTPDHTRVLDTDLTVCVDQARRESGRRDARLAHELLLYTVHGVLHCLGYDDHDEQRYRAMHAQEDAVMDALGLGPVFAQAPKDDPGANETSADQEAAR